jgi:hypothetical protein
MLQKLQFEELPKALRTDLLANNCEFAIDDELWFFQDKEGTIWCENHVFPEHQVAMKWHGSGWEPTDWDAWKVRQPDVSGGHNHY